MSQTTDDEGAEELIAGNADRLPPKKFNLDPEARTVRAVTGSLVVFTGFALSGLAAVWLGEEFAGMSGWAFAAAVCAYVALAIMACAVPRPLDGDGLSLDANRLTLTRAGHHRHWSWSDLGDFTIATRSRLMGWILGRRISISISGMPSTIPTNESAHRAAATLCIAGEYLATDDEIIANLIAFRDRQAEQATPEEPRAPLPEATYHLRDQRARAVKTRMMPISGVISWICVYASASIVGGLYDGWQYFVGYWTDPLSHRIILTVATLFVVYDIWSGLRKSSPAGNRLQIDASGLLLAIDGRRRRWRWDSVSTPEIQDVSEPDGATRRCIMFIARHDGLSSGSEPTPGLLPAALRFVIEDLYDAPLETIVGQIVESRSRFRSDPGAAIDAVPGAVPLPT